MGVGNGPLTKQEPAIGPPGESWLGPQWGRARGRDTGADARNRTPQGDAQARGSP